MSEKSWAEWVRENVDRGCSPLSLYKVMIESGVEGPGEILSGVVGEWEYPRPRVKGGYIRMSAPEIVVIPQLLSAQECDELMALAEEKGLARSKVICNDTGENVPNPHRTSSSVCMMKGDEICERVEGRLAELTGWPVTHAEGLQVIRYQVGEEYKPHYDWFDPNVVGTAKSIGHAGQRLATTVIYLSPADEGGGTSFPKIGLEVRLNKGDAVFFSDVKVDGSPDKNTLHAGMPVIKGVKTIATYWQREHKF